jgi:uncharacterized protein
VTQVSGSWRQSIADYILREARPPEKFSHQPRLYALARKIGEGFNYDDDVVYAAAWLHDLGVFIGHRPEDPALLSKWDNTAYAIAKTPAILREVSFPEQKINAVLACIATHQPHHAPQTIEATILRDADILEQLGAVGVLRTVCKIGRDTRFHSFTDAVHSLQKAVDILPPFIHLPQARLLAEPRVAILRAFLKSVSDEAGEFLL